MRMSTVSLEQEFWDALRDIASQRKLNITDLVRFVDTTKTRPNLASALRVFALQHRVKPER